MPTLKLKKAPLIYFVVKDSPKRMDYKFGYKPTPESALKYHIGQWQRGHDDKLHRYMFTKGYDTREEAEALMSKYNKELMESFPWKHYEVVK